MWGGLRLVLEAHGGGRELLSLDGRGVTPEIRPSRGLGSERSEKQLEPGHSTWLRCSWPSCRKSVCTPGLSLKQKIRHTCPSPPAHRYPPPPPHTHTPGQHPEGQQEGARGLWRVPGSQVCEEALWRCMLGSAVPWEFPPGVSCRRRGD